MYTQGESVIDTKLVLAHSWHVCPTSQHVKLAHTRGALGDMGPGRRIVGLCREATSSKQHPSTVSTIHFRNVFGKGQGRRVHENATLSKIFAIHSTISMVFPHILYFPSSIHQSNRSLLECACRSEDDDAWSGCTKVLPLLVVTKLDEGGIDTGLLEEHESLAPMASAFL